MDGVAECLAKNVVHQWHYYEHDGDQLQRRIGKPQEKRGRQEYYGENDELARSLLHTLRIEMQEESGPRRILVDNEVGPWLVMMRGRRNLEAPMRWVWIYLLGHLLWISGIGLAKGGIESSDHAIGLKELRLPQISKGIVVTRRFVLVSKSDDISNLQNCKQDKRSRTTKDHYELAVCPHGQASSARADTASGIVLADLASSCKAAISLAL